MSADVRLHRMRLVAATADASEAASDMELARALIDGVRNAPELAWERYAPLVLRHVEGMTLEEVAEAMELSLATVKRSLRRATARVAQMVDSDDPKRRPTGTAVKGRT